MYTISDLRKLKAIVFNSIFELEDNVTDYNLTNRRLLIRLYSLSLLLDLYNDFKETNKIDLRIQSLLMDCGLEYIQK